MSATASGLGVMAAALKDLVTELTFPNPGESLEGCFCAIHVKNPIVPGSAGCGVVPLGKHRKFSGGVGRVVVDCDAGPEARRGDSELLCRARRLDGPAAFESDEVQAAVLMSAPFDNFGVDQFGRGYCFLHGVHGRLRFRGARVLGPLPLVADVARVVWVQGLRRMKELEVVPVGAGLWHVRKSKVAFGVSEDAGEKFFRSLVSVALADPAARVGVSSTQVGGELREWSAFGNPGLVVGEKAAGEGADELAQYYGTADVSRGFYATIVKSERGVAFVKAVSALVGRFPKVARPDVAACAFAVSELHERFGGTVERRRVMAMLGGEVLRTGAVLHGIAELLSVGVLQREISEVHAVRNLAIAYDRCGFPECERPLSTGEKADVVRVVIAALALYGGLRRGFSFAEHLCLLPALGTFEGFEDVPGEDLLGRLEQAVDVQMRSVGESGDEVGLESEEEL